MAGDQVPIRTPEVKRWSEPATVVSDAGTPRSCIVKTPRETLRRNRKHLQQKAFATYSKSANKPSSEADTFSCT